MSFFGCCCSRNYCSQRLQQSLSFHSKLLNHKLFSNENLFQDVFPMENTSPFSSSYGSLSSEVELDIKAHNSPTEIQVYQSDVENCLFFFAECITSTQGFPIFAFDETH